MRQAFSSWLVLSCYLLAASAGIFGAEESGAAGLTPAQTADVPSVLDYSGPTGADAKGAATAQKVWAEYLGEKGHVKTMPLDRAGKATVEMVLIPPGKYHRGEGNSTPLITPSKPFWDGKYEVTPRQYEVVMDANPSHFKREGKGAALTIGSKAANALTPKQETAETPKESGAAPKKSAGGRVAYMLLVNGAVTDAVVKAANIEGHESVNAPYVGTWHSFVKGMDQIQKGRLDPVEQGKIDVMMIGTLRSYPNAETWKNHLGPDDSTLAGFAALGVKNNPKFRIVWQTYIWPVGQTAKDGKKTLDVSATKKRAASEPLKELEKLVDATNQKHGRKVVLISPVGEATIKLVQMVADGKFPGITDPADLWTEFNMHSNRHVLALTAYCNVAAMYGVSPVGLKPDFSKVTYGGGGKGPGIQSMEGITDEQHAILQKIASETVCGYPYAAAK